MNKHPIFRKFPDNDYVESLLTQDRCEIDYEFPGFMNIYKNLAKIIPIYFTIIDFGCYMAPQCGYFKNHKSYIGVDISSLERFKVKNTEHFYGYISDFIDGNKFDLDVTFAICSYVPDFKSAELIRNTFKNLFCFYPSKSFI